MKKKDEATTDEDEVEGRRRRRIRGRTMKIQKLCGHFLKKNMSEWSF